MKAIWALQLSWVALAVALGPAVADALGGASSPVQLVATVWLWAGWTAGLVAVLVPRDLSLTVVRALAPGALVAALAAAVHGARGIDDVVALAAAAVVVVVAVSPAVTDALVDGSSYGSERRFALRSPPSLLFGPVPLTWTAVVVLPAAAALLLAARNWPVGGALAVASLAAVRFGAPALHRLSRRWVVLVPAGVVVHDDVALADPVLLPAALVRRVGPAPVGTEGLDLTAGAGGLVLEVELAEAIDLLVAGAGRREARTEHARRLLVAPLRPGALLAEAAARNLPVG